MSYNEDIDQTGWSFLTGVMIGSAFGAAIALLLAPKRGQELRSDLRTAAAGVRDTVSSQVNTLRKTAGDVVERGTAIANDASRTISDTAQAVADTGTAMFDASRRTVKRTASSSSGIE